MSELLRASASYPQEPISDEKLAEIRDGLATVTSGPWYLDSVETDGAYGSGEDTSEGFRSYGVRTSAEKRFGQDASICDAVNSDLAVVHEEFDEDGTVAWDDVAKQNLAHIARLDPQTILSLLARLDKAEAERAAATSVAEMNATSGAFWAQRAKNAEERAPAQIDGWQDISTAPYGPEILVGYSSPNGVSACFTSIRRRNGVFVVTNSAWDARTHDYATCTPTHWKPLDPPPVGSGRILADATKSNPHVP